MPVCDTPTCNEQGTRSDSNGGVWCINHYGIFPHECEEDGCGIMVLYDDEPKCFTHSPDEGSSVVGYSARAKASAVNQENDT